MNEIRYNHKLSFHIPHVAWVGNGYQQVPFVLFGGLLANKLEKIGIDGYHIIVADGGYKGRKFSQDIFTVFCDYDHQKAIIDAYKQVCSAMKAEMKQEQYAYEHDGVLVVFEV